jgi:hypothetical protein
MKHLPMLTSAICMLEAGLQLLASSTGEPFPHALSAPASLVIERQRAQESRSCMRAGHKSANVQNSHEVHGLAGGVKAALTLITSHSLQSNPQCRRALISSLRIILTGSYVVISVLAVFGAYWSSRSPVLSIWVDCAQQARHGTGVCACNDEQWRCVEVNDLCERISVLSGSARPCLFVIVLPVATFAER